MICAHRDASEPDIWGEICHFRASVTDPLYQTSVPHRRVPRRSERNVHTGPKMRREDDFFLTDDRFGPLWEISIHIQILLQDKRGVSSVKLSLFGVL